MTQSSLSHPAPSDFPSAGDDGFDECGRDKYPGLDLSPLWRMPEYRRLVVPDGFVSQ